jgi:hypothetical protein
MGCDVAFGDSRGRRRVAAAGVWASPARLKLRTTSKIYLQLTGGDLSAPAELHACAL